jgi:hypothetical protein
MPLETASLSVAMKGVIEALVSLKDEVFTHNLANHHSSYLSQHLAQNFMPLLHLFL